MSENDAELQRLRDAVEAAPADPQAAFLLACAYDGRGFEREAIPHYRRAIENGLAGDDLQMAYINLGSSHRALGEYEQAVAIWRDARSRFPENRALATFLAIGLHNLNEHAAAAELLLTQLAETSADPWVARYRRAILFYADKLDETW
ncbi:MAG TPA: tetratricopeptide repeat protein [Thermomicrobiales bacterium]|jgi:tetratricopeptide (TPR) repeat protein